MSIDQLARAAAAEARDVAAAQVNPTSMLARLYRTRRNRAVGWVATAVLLVVALIIGGTHIAARTARGHVNSPAGPSATPSGSCGHPEVACLGNHRFRVELPAPALVRLPDNFYSDFTWNRLGFDALRKGLEAGVTVMERVVPATNDSSWARDPTAGATAESMAVWLSHRPFLNHTAITRISIGGRPAWRVKAELKPSAPLRALRNHESLAPTFTNADSSEAGFNHRLVGDHILLDTAAAGVVLIWSWSNGAGPAALPGNETFIAALSVG